MLKANECVHVIVLIWIWIYLWNAIHVFLFHGERRRSTTTVVSGNLGVRIRGIGARELPALRQGNVLEWWHSRVHWFRVPNVGASHFYFQFCWWSWREGDSEPHCHGFSFQFSLEHKSRREGRSIVMMKMDINEGPHVCRVMWCQCQRGKWAWSEKNIMLGLTQRKNIELGFLVNIPHFFLSHTPY